MVVDEDAKLTFPYKRLARRICLGPEAAMERSEKQKNMFEGECNSAPTTDREMIWRRSLSSFPQRTTASKHQSSIAFLYVFST